MEISQDKGHFIRGQQESVLSRRVVCMYNVLSPSLSSLSVGTKSLDLLHSLGAQ